MFTFSFLKTFSFTDTSYTISLAILSTSFTFVTLAFYRPQTLILFIALITTLSSILATFFLLQPVFLQTAQKIKRTKVRAFYNSHNPSNSYYIIDDSPDKLSDPEKTRGWNFNAETAWEFEQ